MNMAGNGLRSALVNQLMQAKSRNPIAQGLQQLGAGKGVSPKDKLAALLQRTGPTGISDFPGVPNAGGPNRPVDISPGMMHGGHRGHTGIPDPITNALQPHPGHLDPGAASPGGHGEFRFGKEALAPGGGDSPLPNWVLEGLTNAVAGGGLHPDHMQLILQHLSNAIGQGGQGTLGVGNGASGPAQPVQYQ